MAEDQEIVLSVTVDTDQAVKNIDLLTAAIETTKKNTKELQEENKQLAKSGQQNSAQYQENAKAIALNNAQLSKLNNQRKQAIATTQNQKGSLNQLRAELVKLKNVRNEELAVGSKAFKQANQDIKALNEQIKLAEEQGGDFQRSVGNYGKALEGASAGLSTINPALGNAASGLIAMTKAALAFIATPLGAVLTAIVLALKAVGTYFNRTEEGGDKLAVIMAGLGSVLESVLDIVSALGKLFFEVFVEGFGIAVNFVKANGLVISKTFQQINVASKKVFGSTEEYNKAVADLNETTAELNKLNKENSESWNNIKKSTVEAANSIVATTKATKDMVAAQITIQEIQNDLNRTIRTNTVEEARRRQEIQENLLVSRNFNNSLEVRRQAILKANALENEQLRINKQIAQTQLSIAQASDALHDSNAAGLDEVAEAEKNLINVTTTSLAKQRELTNRITTLNNEEEIKRKKRVADQKADRDRRIKELQEEEKIINEFNSRQEVASQQLAELRKQREIDNAETIEERTQRELELEELKYQQQIDGLSIFTEEFELHWEQHQNNITQINLKGEKEREAIKVRADKLDQARIQRNEARQKAAARSFISLTAQVFAQASDLAKDNAVLSKALAITSATINTFQAITQTLASTPYPFNIPSAIAVGALGAAQVAKIATTDVNSGVGVRSTSGTGISGIAGPIGTQADTSGINGGLTDADILRAALDNLNATVSVTDINAAQNSVKVSQGAATLGQNI